MACGLGLGVVTTMEGVYIKTDVPDNVYLCICVFAYLCICVFVTGVGGFMAAGGSWGY